MSKIMGDACRRGALAAGSPRCLGLSLRTPPYRRSTYGIAAEARTAAGSARTPANRLDAVARMAALEAANCPVFAKPAPNQIVPTQAGRGH